MNAELDLRQLKDITSIKEVGISRPISKWLDLDSVAAVIMTMFIYLAV